MESSGGRALTESESAVIGRVIKEMDRALELSAQGKIGKTPRDATTTNLESAAIFNEEIAEVNEVALSLLVALRELNVSQLRLMRMLNDLQADSKKLDLQCVFATFYYKRLFQDLTTELSQVAAVAINWMARLYENHHELTSI